ncbi:hypothetical protein V2A60_001910 [Cordyceps javanica]
MDILPLPRDPTFPTPETPYLSAEDWDFGPYRTFLHRKYQDLGLSEVPHLPTDHALLTLPLQRIFDAIPAAKLQSFVQTWLYFGILAEFLSLNELEDGRRLVSLEQAREEMAILYREYSKDGDNGKLLTGVHILGQTDTFVERVRLAGDLGPRFHYLHQCLTRSVLIVNNSFNQLDYSIRYSIAALSELFMTNIYASSHLVSPRIVLPIASFNWFRDYLKAGNDVEKQMLSVGWCPSEIEKLRNLFQGVASLHYVTRLRPRTAPSDHVNCTNYACRAFQIDIAKYKPNHVTQGCHCDDVHIDETELGQILRGTDFYPVLKIDTGPDGTGPVSITLERYEPGVNYVALSHVWADGLGNPRANALPTCQVIRMANAVAELNRTMNDSDDPQSEYRIWVDTICCPVELEGKAIALERIADVYKNSAHVLILDSSLTCLNTTTSDLAEMLLRTFSCSAWMRRLWTLQEAILPKSLCIQFQDKAASASDLMRDLYLAGMNDMRFLRIWHDLLNEAYDEKFPSPLFDCIQSNSAALIFNNFNESAEVNVAILGKVQECLDDDDEQMAMHFERERTVMCWHLVQQEVALLNKVIAISNKLADDQVTANLLACGKESSPERDKCLAEVKKWLETTLIGNGKKIPSLRNW